MSPAASGPVAPGSIAAVRGALSGIAGRRLAGVTYVMDPTAHSLEESTGTADMADEAVGLAFGDASVVATWGMTGEDEYLNVTAEPATDLWLPDHYDLIDAGGRGGWPRRVGRIVSGFAITTHAPAFASQEFVLGFRLEFAGAAPAFIALGMLHGGAPRYQPDTLVALFDEAQARRYLTDDGTRSLSRQGLAAVRERNRCSRRCRPVKGTRSASNWSIRWCCRSTRNRRWRRSVPR